MGVLREVPFIERTHCRGVSRGERLPTASVGRQSMCDWRRSFATVGLSLCD